MESGERIIKGPVEGKSMEYTRNLNLKKKKKESGKEKTSWEYAIMEMAGEGYAEWKWLIQAKGDSASVDGE